MIGASVIGIDQQRDVEFGFEGAVAVVHRGFFLLRASYTLGGGTKRAVVRFPCRERQGRT